MFGGRVKGEPRRMKGPGKIGLQIPGIETHGGCILPVAGAD